MNESPNRIKLNNDLWFNVQPDKLIFGATFLPKGYHLTFPFGIKSGNFDLHLTKGAIQFPIVIIEHTNFLVIQNILLHNLLNSFLNNLRPIDKDLLNSKGFQIYAINGFDYELDKEFDFQITKGINGLRNTETSTRLNINQNSQKFEEFVEGLVSKHKNKKMELSEFSELNNSFGIAVSGEQFYFLLKNELTNYELSMFNFLNLDLGQVIKEALGKDLSAYILNSIENGKKILEMDNAKKLIKDMKPPIMTIKTSS